MPKLNRRIALGLVNSFLIVATEDENYNTNKLKAPERWAYMHKIIMESEIFDYHPKEPKGARYFLNIYN
jgi:hypothetical protein